MSAMLGFAMLSSENGTSLSTTTARFIGTVRLEDVPFLTTRKPSAQAPCALGITISESPVRAAAKYRLKAM
jgi:hypothetical protein